MILPSPGGVCRVVSMYYSECGGHAGHYSMVCRGPIPPEYAECATVKVVGRYSKQPLQNRNSSADTCSCQLQGWKFILHPLHNVCWASPYFPAGTHVNFVDSARRMQLATLPKPQPRAMPLAVLGWHPSCCFQPTWMRSPPSLGPPSHLCAPALPLCRQEWPCCHPHLRPTMLLALPFVPCQPWCQLERELAHACCTASA